MKRFVFILFLLLCVPMAAASQITLEDTRIHVDPDGQANVTIERQYDSISSPRISYFVPSQYNPEQLQARDDLGELDCTTQSFESGREILCDPRKMADYTVEITFFADFITYDRQTNTHLFSFVRQVLTPTDRTRLQVVLPEGFGLVQSQGNPSYSPANAHVGSQGRRIFIDWERENVSIGDTVQYRVQYEKLQVLDNVPGSIAGAALILALLIAGGAVYYVRQNRGEQNGSIASVFPVLKDDEQLVIRYIIDNGGEVEQRDIVENVSYSKAKISKLLSDLEDRKLVEKEKQGRVNIVKLAKEVGDLAPAETAETS
jgi:DNA-binding transcriptional ArsR family regulator